MEDQPPAAGRPQKVEVALARSLPFIGAKPFQLSPGSVVTTVRVRLMFRASPPYFLRALGVANLAQSLEVTEIARLEVAAR